jgi:aryl-alcohol dehydrogenase-like predicted oxidoreductase
VLKVPLVDLGKTGLRVSKLGFGEVDFGEKDPFHLGPKEGWRILTEAYKLGVNFWDSSDDYDTHPLGASALKLLPRKDIVISYKTSAKNGREAKRSLKDFLRELGTDYIDIFLLHCVQSDWMKGCSRMLKELDDIKATGTVRAIGLSTHSVTVVKEAALIEEVDVILTICCKASPAVIGKYIPIEDGTIKEMYAAIKLAHENGKAIIAMKILGGRVKGPAPTLVKNYEHSIGSIARLDFVDATLIGMSNLDEVKKNIEAVLSAKALQ